jgi:hypothetical protein
VDVQDLHAVLTGYLPTDDGGRFEGFRKYSNGRIVCEKTKIDLYLWQERSGDIKFVFTRDVGPHYETLLGLFGIREDNVREL